MTQYPILKTSFNHKSFCLTSVATENKTSTTKICLCVIKFQVLETLDEKTESWKSHIKRALTVFRQNTVNVVHHGAETDRLGPSPKFLITTIARVPGFTGLRCKHPPLFHDLIPDVRK